MGPPLSSSTPTSSVKVFDRLLSTPHRGLPARGRSRHARMQSLHVPLPTAQVPLVQQVPRRQALAQCVVECRLHPRLTTSHQVHTMPSLRSSPLSRPRRNRSLHSTSLSLSLSSSLHAFQTPTTALTLAACHPLPLPHQLDCRVLHPSLRGHCPRMDDLAVRRPRCAPLWRTELAPHAMDTRDLTSTTLILLPVVVLLAVHLLQHQLWLQPSKQRGTVMIAQPLLPNATASGKRTTTSTQRRLPTTRNARSWRSRIAVALRLHTACRPLRYLVTAPRLLLILVASMMATTHQRLLTTRLLCHP